MLYDSLQCVGAGGVCKCFELVQGPFGLVRGGIAERSCDEDRTFTLRARFVTRPLVLQVTTFLSRSTPSCNRSSASVNEKRTKPSPEGP